MGTSRRGRNTVDEGEHRLVRRLRPRQRALDLKLLGIAALDGEASFHQSLLAPVLEELVEVRSEPITVFVPQLFALLLILVATLMFWVAEMAEKKFKREDITKEI